MKKYHQRNTYWQIWNELNLAYPQIITETQIFEYVTTYVTTHYNYDCSVQVHRAVLQI